MKIKNQKSKITFVDVHEKNIYGKSCSKAINTMMFVRKSEENKIQIPTLIKKGDFE